MVYYIYQATKIVFNVTNGILNVPGNEDKKIKIFQFISKNFPNHIFCIDYHDDNWDFVGAMLNHFYSVAKEKEIYEMIMLQIIKPLVKQMLGDVSWFNGILLSVCDNKELFMDVLKKGFDAGFKAGHTIDKFNFREQKCFLRVEGSVEYLKEMGVKEENLPNDKDYACGEENY